ncbi:uncharacterized protein [Amphiura filiformis]|uniref:uncharacterized protein n=1 Tax=Amphiura filiformis TaxID=82378 RepID=UPI003B223CD0
MLNNRKCEFIHRYETYDTSKSESRKKTFISILISKTSKSSKGQRTITAIEQNHAVNPGDRSADTWVSSDRCNVFGDKGHRSTQISI